MKVYSLLTNCHVACSITQTIIQNSDYDCKKRYKSSRASYQCISWQCVGVPKPNLLQRW